LLKRFPAVILFMGFGGNDSTGALASVWSNPEVPLLDDLGLLLLMGIEEMRSETWPCKFDPMVDNNPCFALLFSSDRASQKAL
jgi:hypothetical protein